MEDKMSVKITLDKLKAAERGLGKIMNTDLPYYQLLQTA